MNWSKTGTISVGPLAASGWDYPGKRQFGPVTDSFVCAVVQVNEHRAPILAQGVWIQGISVILGGDVTPSGIHVLYRLVMTPVTVFHSDHLCPGSQSQYLVPHANATDGLVSLHSLLQMSNGRCVPGGIAWPLLIKIPS